MALQTLSSGASNTRRTISIQTTVSQVAYTVPAGKSFKGSVRGNASGCSLYINGTVVNQSLPFAATDPQFFIELNSGDSIMTNAIGFIIGVES